MDQVPPPTRRASPCTSAQLRMVDSDLPAISAACFRVMIELAKRDPPWEPIRMMPRLRFSTSSTPSAILGLICIRYAS